MAELREISGNELIEQAKAGPIDPDNLKQYGSKRFVPISPADRLYLTALGHGNDVRFARLFRDAWSHIPQEDRDPMTGYWRPLERIPGLLGISITLENLRAMRSRKENGVCELDGALLKFYAPVVDLMPPRHVRALVAHELAHVLQAANESLVNSEGLHCITNEDMMDMAARSRVSFEDMKAKVLHQLDPVEHDADKIAKRWGFSVRGMDLWLEKNMDWDKLPDPVY